jgi:hypothetical protein
MIEFEARLSDAPPVTIAVNPQHVLYIEPNGPGATRIWIADRYATLLIAESYTDVLAKLNAVLSLSRAVQP